MRICECGCGTEVKRRFVRGHVTRSPGGRFVKDEVDISIEVLRTDLSYTMTIEPEFECPCWKCREARRTATVMLREWLDEMADQNWRSVTSRPTISSQP